MNKPNFTLDEFVERISVLTERADGVDKFRIDFRIGPNTVRMSYDAKHDKRLDPAKRTAKRSKP